MPQRLFQDAGGTTPAIIAGQPVGLIKRLAGSVDAVQATALSKPTLARHPKSGMRNLANGAQNTALGAATYWQNPSLQNLVTITKVGNGLEGGIPYVDYRLQSDGPSNSVVTFGYNQNNSAQPAVVGDKYIARATFRVLDMPVKGNLISTRIRVAEYDASNQQTAFTNSPTYLPVAGDYEAVVHHIVAGPASTQVRTFLNIAMGGSVESQLPIDVTVRVKGLQFERGDTQTPLQFNYGLNDIVEAGVADLWHLYNDGGDSLNVTLPAGIYGLASIDINREITITTITSDGTTPINTLCHERQLDVIMRAGAFTSGEETAIRDYWGRVFA